MTPVQWMILRRASHSHPYGEGIVIKSWWGVSAKVDFVRPSLWGKEPREGSKGITFPSRGRIARNISPCVAMKSISLFYHYFILFFFLHIPPNSFLLYFILAFSLPLYYNLLCHESWNNLCLTYLLLVQINVMLIIMSTFKASEWSEINCTEKKMMIT